MVKYHILLADWMANLPGPKKKSRNRKLLAKHRDYLQHVFDVEGEYPTSARLREIADLTGISVKSLRNWFGHVRLERDKKSSNHNSDSTLQPMTNANKDLGTVVKTSLLIKTI